MAVVEWVMGSGRMSARLRSLTRCWTAWLPKPAQRGKPQDVQVTVGSAGTLGIVVGDDRSVLNHVPADLDPPYMVSEGGEEPFVFDVAGDHYSETLRRNAIPPDAARAAMGHFLMTGELSPEVQWEEV